MDGNYLNVDLDVRSDASLAPLIAGFADEAVVLHERQDEAGWFAIFELSDCEIASPESAIERFCALIEGLPAAARACWDGCAVREFNIGYAAQPGSSAVHASVPPATLGRAIAVGAAIGFTSYRNEEQSDQAHATKGAETT